MACSAVAAILAASGCGGTHKRARTGSSASASCPTTRANGVAGRGQKSDPSFYGNRWISTLLPHDGSVVILSGEQVRHPQVLARLAADGMFGIARPDGSFYLKLPWFWNGPGSRPALRISGRRIDAPAPALRLDGSPGSGEPRVWASGLLFSSAGCWQIDGAAEAGRLTFVLRVVDRHR